MSEYKILVPSDSFDFTKLSLVNPITLQGGTFFTKLLNENNELYIQTPLCTTKNGFVKTAKKINCDMLFERSNTEFIEWFENLEEYCQKLIFKKSKDWFQDEIELDDIENAFTSSIRSYKSGMFNMIKTSTESPRISHSVSNLSIYDQQERQMKLEDVTPDNTMVCILQIHGVKFTPKNFQIMIQLKQVMVLNDNMFSKCQIKPNVEVRSKKKISLKSYDTENKLDDDDNDEEINITEYTDNDDNADNEINLPTINQETLESNNTLETDKDLENNEEKVEVEENQNLEELVNFEVDKIEEVQLNLDNAENLEEITLKRPDEVYLEIYSEARKKAKEAKKHALISYLELKKIKSEWDVEGLDDSDDEFDKAMMNKAMEGKKNSESGPIELLNH
jgi:hypothetical protein